MGGDSKTLAEHLECLARQSRVRTSFLEELRRILERKGISLHEDVAPYRHALEEAVRRKEELDRVARRTRESLDRLQERLDRLGAACRLQLRQVQALRHYLRCYALAFRAAGLSARTMTLWSRRARQGKGRRKRLYVVPGPKDVQ